MNGQNQSEAAQKISPKACGRRFPVSTKAYTKKDYAYLSSFSRVAESVALRSFVCHEDLEPSPDQRGDDGKSDACRTSSSLLDCTTSVSPACSISSSAQIRAKANTSLTELEGKRQSKSLSKSGQPHQHHLHHHKQDHSKCRHHDNRSESSTLTSPVESMVNADMQKANEENPGSGSKSELKATKFDLPSTTENCSLQPEEGPVKLKTKVKSGYVPAVVPPKFGSWDTKNPPSGDAYTLIFKRLRDEKKAGAIPLCESLSYPKAQKAELSLGLEIQAKEPWFPNPNTKNNPVGSTTNTKAAQGQLRWILCCKASVLDD